MPIDIQTIARYLDSHSLKYQLRSSDTGDFIHLGFATQRFESPSGDKHLHLYIVLEEKGEFFRVVSPNCYSVPDEGFQRSFFKTLLMISSESKMVQFSCDNPSLIEFEKEASLDLEGIKPLLLAEEWITATVEMPIEDGNMTEMQTLRAVFALVKILEYYHPVIVNSLKTGEIDFTIVEQSGFIMDLMNQLIEIDGIDDSSEEFEPTEAVSEDESDSESSSTDFDGFI